MEIGFIVAPQPTEYSEAMSLIQCEVTAPLEVVQFRS